ncbi:MAG: L,D-transpeptidase family protein [Woeseiaceae bacterium]|nr:L,D-transpeptidase family protein [Woeseiaceae bacterium]
MRTSRSIFPSILLSLALSSAALAQLAGQPDRIRSFLEGLDAGDAPIIAGERLLEPDLVSRVYRDRDHAPLWVDRGPLAAQVPGLLSAISRSVGHGFAPERYHRSVLEKLLAAEDAPSRTALEILLTDAFLGQALHRGRGAVFPPNLDANWQLPQAEVDAVALLANSAAERAEIPTVLEALWPADPEYWRLVERRAEIAASGDETTVQIAAGPLLKPGQTSDRVILLKQRLMGPGEHTPVYDDDLRREVVAFQRAAGLEPDGLVGANTLEVMNATRVSWIERIDANLERWRWLPRQSPETYIRVNIAAFTLRVMDKGVPALSMNVIVGQPYRQTPVFTETLKYMVLNPYWNVPYSIATKDKLPALKKNAAAEAAKGFEVKPQGSDRFVAVDALDWSNTNARNFNVLLRQKPGPQNALGRIKFMMPNPHAVYLHDTPSRELFARQERSFSSGCIRLEQPLVLARWLLSREAHPAADSLDSMLASNETRTVNLKEHVPTYLVYFTAFSLEDGEVTFRRDIYERDAVVIAALREQNR